MSSVVDFYNRHPITETQILDAVGFHSNPDAKLYPEDLYPFDQDHYGGLGAVDRLIECCKITECEQVIDICSGLGGPARYIAAQTGANVTGIDITKTRAIGAARLTRLVNLTPRVNFVNADATRLPIASKTFDVIISQEAFLHIKDKRSLFNELYRIVSTKGRLAFSDWISFPAITDATRERLEFEIIANNISTVDEYSELLTETGWINIETHDLSKQWKNILIDRLEMFRGMSDETIRQHGEKVNSNYIRAYEFFVEQITTEKLGGVLILATPL